MFKHNARARERADTTQRAWFYQLPVQTDTAPRAQITFKVVFFIVKKYIIIKIKRHIQ